MPTATTTAAGEEASLGKARPGLTLPHLALAPLRRSLLPAWRGDGRWQSTEKPNARALRKSAGVCALDTRAGRPERIR